jgi:hypothetical protein
VSAAHCVPGRKPPPVEIAFGLSIDGARDYRRAAVIRKHPSYDDTPRYDLALFGFEKDAPRGYSVVELADEKVELTPDSTLLVAGYGRTTYSKTVPWSELGRLKKTVVPVAWPPETGVIQTWLNSKNEGFSHGDSGGSGYLEVGGHLQLIGVISRMMIEPGKVTPYYEALSDVRSNREWLLTEAAAIEEELRARKARK